MIDYEKLKIAHELASKLKGKIYFDIQYTDDNVHLQFLDIDALINALQNLQSEPKYKIGQMDEFIRHMETRAEYVAKVIDGEINKEYINFINIDMCKGALKELNNLIVYAKILKKESEILK